MARRKETLTIPGVRSETPGDRDNGKIFILTEMDAYNGQDWALRALLALAASGATLPDGALGAGMAGLAGFGITALLQAPYMALKPLLDEMLAQARYQHYDTKGKASGEPQFIVPGPNCCVEEIKTFLTLQTALVKLHTGFSPAAATPT
jgi:hypothetical protein